ncbi:CLUMA_CG020949, isoform A [Clunio marinus]|uniref:CLUMA_CG020949, isoform A n=1 Tax=Clunio marinus TaxID=568069 RepID=A0A1J1J6Q4_9DIPT|nr:CLUMA_CG020949, isoform A [Clunio marinus]
MDKQNSNTFLCNDDWIQDESFLDSIFSMENELLNTSDFGAQPNDLIENMLNFSDPPMFNCAENFKNEPIFSSGASDSGLSSDNLDLDINNDLDILNSCLPSPRNYSQEKSEIIDRMETMNTSNETAPLKRSARSSRNNSKFGSLTLKNVNNNNKKGNQKLLHFKNVNNKSRSIIVPVSSKNIKDFHSIKIVNTGSLQFKGANIKAVAANLLQKSKQGLLQKNILIPKQKVECNEMEDDDDENMLNFDDIMQESDEVIAAHEDDDDDMSSVESCSSGYPKLLLTNEEKRLLSKEGITLPTSYPLTKHEERELKRIRRKIRNKISAQDSRKRKKEYIDGLEERVKQCSEENQHLIKRIKVLQNQNHDLMSKMKKLQNLLTKSTGKSAQPATCLMILLLSMALVALPNINLNKNTLNANDLVTASFGDQQNRRNLLFDLKSELEDMDSEDSLMYVSNEHDYVENVYKYVFQLSSEASSLTLPSTKSSKMLIDYDIDSIDEWEQKKRSENGNLIIYNDGTTQKSKITVSKDLFDIGSTQATLNKTQSQNELNESHKILAQNIINLASATPLQKSSTS